MKDKQLKHSIDCYIIRNVNLPDCYWLRSMKGTTKNAISSFMYNGRKLSDLLFTCDSTYSYRRSKASVVMFLEI